MGRLDYYAVLGFGRDATTEEVKAVYRQLARAFHPDANVDDAKAEDFAAAEHFKKITEAYTVLSDPEKRALYDHWGESWREAEKKGRRSPARQRARLVPMSQPGRKRRLQDDLLEHTERRLGVSVAGIELIADRSGRDRGRTHWPARRGRGFRWNPRPADRAAAPATEGLNTRLLHRGSHDDDERVLDRPPVDAM